MRWPIQHLLLLANAAPAWHRKVGVRFANGGKSLLVSESNGHELVLTLGELANGHRTLWKRIQADTQDRSLLFVITPDLKYSAYSSPLFSSDLYIVDNLR